MNKPCIKHETVLELFKTHHRGSLFPIGEVVPLFLAVQHRFRYHLAGKDRYSVILYYIVLFFLDIWFKIPNEGGVFKT